MNAALVLTLALMGQLDYDVIALAHPVENFPGVQSFSEQSGPFVHSPLTHILRVKPDASEVVLAEGVHDLQPTNDGNGILFSKVSADKKYCDGFLLNVTTGEVTQLTDAANEWSPPAGVYPTGSSGRVWNTAFIDTPEGYIFTSTRDGIKSPGEAFPAALLYRIVDGHAERIDFHNFGGVLHPHYFDGWVYFSTAEQQGLRGRNGAAWAIKRIKPDGTSFEPVVSAIPPTASFGWHIVTHTSDGTTAVDGYYDTRTIGFIVAFARFIATPFGPPTMFGEPGASKNPTFWNGVDFNDRVRQGNIWRVGFQPRGMFSPFPWAHRQDVVNTTKDAEGNTVYQREIGHPAGVPGNRLLVSWTGDNPERRDWGVYLSKRITDKPPAPGEGIPIAFPREYLTKVVDKPDRHEWYGKPLVSYEDLYGTPPPPMRPSPKADLPPGSPYALVGSTSVDRPEVVDPSKAPFYSTQVAIDPEQVHYIRVTGFNPTQYGLNIAQEVSNQHPSMGAGGQTKNREGFLSAINERMGFYADIPVRKWRTPEGKLHVGPGAPEGSTPVMAPDGRPDTSWAAYIPGDQSFSFQLLNELKQSIDLTTAKTWRQVRPGEQRTNCQGCHNHNQPDTFQFDECAAGLSDYVIPKLDKLHRVIYDEHIKPIEDRTGIAIGPTPYKVSGGPKPFASAGWDLLDNPAFTAAEKETLAAWRDTGFMAAGVFNDGTPITKASGHGPWSDTMPPTLRLEVRSDGAYIGAADPDSGVNYASLQVLRNGTDITGQFAWDGDVAKGPAGDGTWEVSIRDNQTATGAEQGNVARIVRTIGELPDPPPEPDPDQQEIAELLARIEALEAQVAALEAKGGQDAATITQLKAKIEAARAALGD